MKMWTYNLLVSSAKYENKIWFPLESVGKTGLSSKYIYVDGLKVKEDYVREQKEHFWK